MSSAAKHETMGYHAGYRFNQTRSSKECSMKKSLFLLVAIVILVPITAAAQKVRTDFDKATSFAGFKTFAWREGTPAKNPLVDQRIIAGVESRLAAKGITKASSVETADLVIAYHAATDTETQINTYSTGGWGYGYGWGWGGGGGSTTTNVQKIPVGELIVDMADVKQRKFVWRGTATATLSSKPEKNEKLINNALDKMFEAFPPGAAKAK